MRVLIVSDSHGRNENVKKALEKAVSTVGKVDLMVHLGDVGNNYQEIERMTGVPTYMVAGNNDYGGFLRDTIVFHIGKHKVFACHGHRMGVHRDLSVLRYHALSNECDIAMFGHTHVPVIDEGDVTIINPGSLTYPRQFGHKKTFIIMELDEEGNATYTLDNI